MLGGKCVGRQSRRDLDLAAISTRSRCARRAHREAKSKLPQEGRVAAERQPVAARGGDVMEPSYEGAVWLIGSNQVVIA